MLATQKTIRPYTSGWIDFLNRRQGDETPHVDDKFFLAGNAHGGTEVDGSVSGTTVWTQTDDVLVGTATGQAVGDLAMVLWALTPSTFPVMIEAPIRALTPPGQFAQAGIGFTSGVVGSSNVIYATHGNGTFGVNSGTIANVTVNEVAMTVPSANPRAQWYYFRLIWTTTSTFKMGRSVSGVDWEYTAALTEAFTPTHFGVVVSAYGSTLPSQAIFEYLRVAETDPTA